MYQYQDDFYFYIKEVKVHTFEFATCDQSKYICYNYFHNYYIDEEKGNLCSEFFIPFHLTEVYKNCTFTNILGFWLERTFKEMDRCGKSLKHRMTIAN